MCSTEEHKWEIGLIRPAINLMLKRVAWLVLLAVPFCCQNVRSAPCTAGNSRFVLTSVSGGQHCPSTELAVAWPSINIKQQADCNYTFSGLKHRFEYHVTFAQVDYPTRGGTRQPYVALKDTKMDASSDASGSNSYRTYDLVDRYRNDTLSGFLASWVYVGLPWLATGPFGPTTSTPGNYTASPAGPSSFNLLSKDTGCTFTYRIVSGSFAELKPTPCKPGSSSDCPASGSCGPGKYQQQDAVSTNVCVLCPAGTYSSSNSSKECAPCKAGAVAAAVGSTSCQACAAPLVASYYSPTACVPVCDKQDDYNLPTFGQNVIYNNGQACDMAVCPNGTVSSPNNECLAAQNGNLCVAVSAAGSTTCKAKAESSMSKDTQTGGWGGAVLQLDSADTSAAVCSTGVKQLAAWLGGRQTWLGFNFTQWGANFAPGGYYAPIYGLQWQALGSLNGSNLMSYPICGNAHGGPGPQKMLTQGRGTVLDSTAYLFQSLLSAPPPGTSPDAYIDRIAFRVILEKGSRPDQISTTWFRDGSIGNCPYVTSLSARRTAGGDLATGTCRLTFKVMSGSILGAAAASGSTQCTAGTYTVNHAAGARSCIACPPGNVVASDGKSCSPCTGNSYTNTWGAAKCLPCQNPSYSNDYCFSG